MKENYFGGNTPKVVDYRNARYQGLLSSSDKRHGFGILVDDAMNIYCSEWSQGLMDGMTFLYLSNGCIAYGQWKQGHPHGVNVFSNKHFTLFGNYLYGKPCGEVIVMDEKISELVILNG